MANAPDPGFAFWSPESRRALPLAEMSREIHREVGIRRDIYPGLVNRHRLTELDAQAEIAIMAALDQEFAWAAENPTGGTDRPINSYTYQAKVHCLRREILIRRSFYPKQIAARRITYEDAELHLSAIECAHAWYWEQGLNFMEGNREPHHDGNLPYYRPGDCGWNIRAELERREAWATAQGYDINGPWYCAGIYDGDWSAFPKLTMEAAE